MKKLKLSSTLNHKHDHYSPYEVIVEKVINLYGKSFEKLKNNPFAKNPYIAEYCDLICINSNDVAHCLLFVDHESGDGILVESEGSDYARKSQFIPNARALIENNEMTDAERKIHNKISAIAEKLAEMAHCGNKYFSFEDILSEETLDEIKSTILQAVCEKLQQREDIRSVQINDLDIPFQSGIDVEAKPTQGLTFYCPLKIVREPEELDDDWDEKVLKDDFEEIPSEYAVGCADEINRFIQNYSEPEEENRGLMVYYDDDPAVCEKVFSAIPSVKEINGELMGVFECRIVGELTDSELEELCSYLTGQASDGWGEGLEQHEIKTNDYGEIYVIFWNDSNDWSLQTEEEFFGQEICQEPEINMTM